MPPQSFPIAARSTGCLQRAELSRLRALLAVTTDPAGRIRLMELIRKLEEQLYWAELEARVQPALLPAPACPPSVCALAAGATGLP